MPKIIATLFTAGLLLCQASVSHAVAIFMFIDGVKGESKDNAHKDWTDVQSTNWAHGEAPPGSPVKIQFGRLQITKLNDSISPLLALAAATGLAFKELKLEMIRSGPVPVVVSRVKLRGARVASYATAVQDGPNAPTDSIGFSFDQITWINFKVDATGQQIPGNAGCFDLKTNTACTPGF